MFFHGTIRKYTAALLDVFNDIEIQYEDSNGDPITKAIPLAYSSREKARILEGHVAEQLLSGNYSVLPRASLALESMVKAEQRVTNKNNKISRYKTDDTLEYSYNSVPYEFTYSIIVQCRGMNEVTQVVEQIAPKFNPTVNIDIWDVSNLNEPTRVPLRLTDVSFESEDYDELSSNIFTVTMQMSLMGNLYPPIKEQGRIKEFIMSINQVDGDYFERKSISAWDVDINGYIIGGGPGEYPDAFENVGSPTASTPGISIQASKIGVIDVNNYYEGSTLEEILAEIAEKNFQPMSEKGQPNGYASLNNQGKVPYSQLPYYGSDILEYNDFSEFPLIGDETAIYIDKGNDNVYQWDGSQYTQIDNFTTVAQTAAALTTPREITVSLDGYSSGTAIFDGSSNISINLTSSTKVITTDRLPITGNVAFLPSKSIEVIDNAYIYRDERNVASVFECSMAPDGLSISFDPDDGLDGLECTVRYFAQV